MDLSAVGSVAQSVYHYDWRDVVQYALAVGAGADELSYIYEGSGLQVIPSFAVVPAYAVAHELNRRANGDPRGLLHLSQRIRLYRPIPAAGELHTRGTLSNIYDHGALATTVSVTDTADAYGSPVFATEWTVAYLRDGGFRGPRAPRRERVRLDARAPDFSIVQPTLGIQALLYRLTGDTNPIHVDPEVARQAGFQRPLLHGLCTYGTICLAVLRHLQAAGAVVISRLQEFEGEFRKPVFPGETLVIDGWLQGQELLLQVGVRERPGEVVFRNGRMNFDSGSS